MATSPGPTRARTATPPASRVKRDAADVLALSDLPVCSKGAFPGLGQQAPASYGLQVDDGHGKGIGGPKPAALSPFGGRETR